METKVSNATFSPRTRTILVVVLLLLLVLVPLLLVFLSTTPRVVVANALSSPAGDTVYIEGKLVPNSYVLSPDATNASFQIYDSDKCGDASNCYEEGFDTISVEYSGPVGNLFFNDHSVFNITGFVDSGKVLQAERLSVKCPTKYISEAERNDEDAFDSYYQPLNSSTS